MIFQRTHAFSMDIRAGEVIYLFKYALIDYIICTYEFITHIKHNFSGHGKKRMLNEFQRQAPISDDWSLLKSLYPSYRRSPLSEMAHILNVIYYKNNIAVWFVIYVCYYLLENYSFSALTCRSR